MILEFQALGSVVSPIQSRGGEKRARREGEREREKLFNEKKSPIKQTIVFLRCKCTFNSYILSFFHFGPYILILPFLVHKPINACYFRHFRQSTDKNS